MTTPQPRPALRRAPDADLHPALVVAPEQVPPLRPVSEAPVAKKKEEPAAKKKSKAPQRPAGRTGAQIFLSAGHATSDVWRSSKQVQVKVSLPKAVRKELKHVAAATNSSVEQVIARAVREWLAQR